MDYGTDLSHWNAVSDANALRASGRVFASIKATDGAGGVDASYASKVAQLKQAGIVVGPYHFAEGGDPVAEANHFKAVCGGELGSGHLLWMLDMEAAAARGSANSFIVAFTKTMGSPGFVYGNKDWWDNVLRNADWGGIPTLFDWVARYNNAPGSPGVNGSFAMNQYTDSLSAAGVAGAIDGDCTMPGWSLQGLTSGQTAAPAPAPVSTPPATSSSDVWVVQAGDTLSRIASAWGVTVSAVAAANGIPDPNKIYVGQTIHRPGSASAAPLPAPAGSYTVVAGDTLSGIAAKEKTTVAVLVALNHIANPDRIGVGQVLVLPTAGPVVSAPASGTYTVVAGDTLSSIAAKLHYPGGWPALASHNGISNPNRITVGERINY